MIYRVTLSFTVAVTVPMHLFELPLVKDLTNDRNLT